MIPVRSITARAYAKINLSLRILGVRSDGDHELRTVFQSVSLHDTLTFRATRGPFAIDCDDPLCPIDRTNLMWQAAEAVWRASTRRGAPRGLTVRLAKRIPLQSGLGGGSSDAAAALRGCAACWRVNLDREQQLAMAVKLGADVPYFLEGGTVLGLDRGDTLFPLIDRPPAWVTLVIPPFGVSTRDAYGWFDMGDGSRSVSSRTSSHNDLEPVVAVRHPEITEMVKALQKAGASHAAMSGSGSAVFGLFGTERQAEDAAGELKKPRHQVFVARTLDRARYQALR